MTRSGYYIRKYKLDELPQLINVFIGDMSLVGPRPEVRKYVDLYTPEQLHVLDVRPGITDMASIRYRNENELLEQAADPEQYYRDVVMQDKLRINLEYVADHSFIKDLKTSLIEGFLFSAGMITLLDKSSGPLQRRKYAPVGAVDERLVEGGQVDARGTLGGMAHA